MVNFSMKRRSARKEVTEAAPTESKNGILYEIDDCPSFILTLFLALQHYLTMISAVVSIPFILTPALCMSEEDPAKSYIISTMIFVSAVVTYIQVTFGCRLPIVQGGTISFLVPTLAILRQPQWKCPVPEVLDSMSSIEQTEVWQIRMREISGAIILSSLFQVFIGYFGIIGKLLPFVSPLVIVPVVSLAGFSLFEEAAAASSKNWSMAALTIILLTIFSQCLSEVTVPTISYSLKSGFTITRFHLFKLFPILTAIVIMWGLSGILTFFNILPEGNAGRTDTNLGIIHDAQWIRIPYPGQWGWPTYSISSTLGMLAGVLACTVESLGYYPTIARLSGAPAPPLHAINRGIGTEGLGTFIAGFWGCGNGTNTFAENVCTISVTKAGSRRIIQFACVIMLLQGVFNKFGALFMIIPEPIVGGIFCVMFGLIIACGLSSLQFIDLNSSRNLYILGFSLLFSLSLSKWMIHNAKVVQTGYPVLDNIITVLCSTSILIGGFIGCLLDNLIPGTDEERGITAWSNQMKRQSVSESNETVDIEPQDTNWPYNTYDFPVGMNFIRRFKHLKLIPCVPGYKSA